jgi:hypothetical protein
MSNTTERLPDRARLGGRRTLIQSVAVIYARYSSENQKAASIEDQHEVCRRYIDQN